jgi:hypothetical protein
MAPTTAPIGFNPPVKRSLDDTPTARHHGPPPGISEEKEP